MKTKLFIMAMLLMPMMFGCSKDNGMEKRIVGDWFMCYSKTSDSSQDYYEEDTYTQETTNMFAFSGCESLVSVDASRCMNFDSISRNAFEGCPIQEFLLGTLMPPSLYDAYNVAIFEYTPEAVLKVPAESVETYKNSDWAEYFPNIVALEQ